MRRVIWQDTDINLDDWREFLAEEYPDVTDGTEQLRIIQEINGSYLEDERRNLDLDPGGQIVVIARLGLWDGKRMALKMLGRSLSDIFFDDRCDTHAWYVEDGELRGEGWHHDGVNEYIFRAMRPDVAQELFDHVRYGTASLSEYLEATRSLAPDVCRVYGWKE